MREHKHERLHDSCWFELVRNTCGKAFPVRGSPDAQLVHGLAPLP